jgi:RNA polymerase sigma factor (TIGR02999 family)
MEGKSGNPAAVRSGSVGAAELLPEIYDQLRLLAAARLAHERPGQTLQATALVHEAWLRLLNSDHQTCTTEAQFFAAAAEAMRRILVENARRKKRLKHGGAFVRVDFEETDIPSPMRPDELLSVDEALNELATVHPEAAEVIKLRFFVGLTDEQAARVLGLSRRTADRHWAFGRAWLARAIAGPNRRERYDSV